MKSYQKHLWGYVVIAMIVFSIGIYFRLYPLLSYAPESSTEKASLWVLANLKRQVATQVQNQYPHIPDDQKNILTQKLFQNLISAEGSQVRTTIDEVSQNIKKSQTGQRQLPYLLASDSFYYYGLTQNILCTGTISDTIRGSKYYNDMMLAPGGHWEPFNLHPYVGYVIFKFLQIFNPSIDLMYALSYTPLVITLLALIAFLVVSHLLGCGLTTTFIGATFFILAPIFVKRSTFGWYDNDPYNTFFPLLILACVFSGLRYKSSTHPRRSLAIVSGLCAIAMMLYAFFWHGWVFMFSILLVSGIAIILYNHFLNPQKRNISHLLLFFGVFILGSFASISLAFGSQEFFRLFVEGWVALKNFLSPQLSAWPDLFISVSELKKASLSSIIQLTGGMTLFLISILGVIVSVIKLLFFKNRNNGIEDESFQTIIILVFYAVSFFITFGAQRFAMLCLVPVSLMFLRGLECIVLSIKKTLDLFKLEEKRKRILFHGLAGCLILLVLIPARSLQQSIKSLLNPIFNSTWEKVLVHIRENSPEESIVNSWWPPGHFIKSVAHRRVTFDGATINFPQAYWMANVFLSQSEEEALGYLRMLNNSANNATVYLQDLGFSLVESVSVLKQITALDALRARMVLNTIIKEPHARRKKIQIDKILALTHDRPPPSYLLIYKEFVENNLQLKFIGQWNFKAIAEINADPQLLQKVPKPNSKEYVQFLWDLIGGPFRYSGVLPQLNRAGDIVLFENQMTIDIKNYTCQINSPTYGRGTPYSLFYLEGDKIVEKVFENPNLSYSVVLLEDPSQHSCILLDRNLANSLLMRLFFFKGKGLRYFKPFIEASDLTQRTQIQTYEIDWDQFEKDF